MNYQTGKGEVSEKCNLLCMDVHFDDVARNPFAMNSKGTRKPFLWRLQINIFILFNFTITNLQRTVYCYFQNI